MTSKKQRDWQETLVNTKTNKPTQKKGRKVPSAVVPVSSRAKPAGSSTSKPNVAFGRSNSFSSRSGDSGATGVKVGGSLKRGSLGHRGSTSHQVSRQASHPARPALPLSSSRSFSSLHTSSLTAAPFKRSSRSLSRLDQRATGEDLCTRSQVKKGQSPIKNVSDAGRLSFSEERIIRDHKEQCHGHQAEKVESGSSSEQLGSSSSEVSTPACPHHCNKVKKQPDLLNCKKGWMMQQSACGQWQRNWFVLTDQFLRFYKDSVAEEAADVDGEINLSACFGITDYPAQRNCGFQIHTKDGVFTLCAVTSGMRRNWVQAVLKNVRPALTPDIGSSPLEQSTEVLGEAQPLNSCLQEHSSCDCAEDTHQQREQQEIHLQAEMKGCTTDISSSHLSSASPAPSSVSPSHQADDSEGSPCHQFPYLVGTSQNGTTAVSSFVEGATTPAVLPSEESYDQYSKVQVKTTDIKISVNGSCTKEREKWPCEPQMGQLVKELEQTQRELSQLKQLNENLQHELQEEREVHSREMNDLLSHFNSSSEQAPALQQLQKMNHDLRVELEALKRSHEEAREAELRRRVDLLAQQAQLLVTGDATALAQAQLEKDRQRFHEQKMEWERCMESLKSQLRVSEDQGKEAESRLIRQEQKLQNYLDLEREADQMRQRLQEVTTQLCANEEAQAQKETRLQKHLMLLQASQDRERRSLNASLVQAEQQSQDLKERLDRAEHQVECLNKTQTWTREIEEAQQQLQEELTCTVSALQSLQEERDQLERHCQELQNQLSEADGELSRLQSRLKTEETHYYNLEHSYERVSEELQLALGKVHQRESETQEMHEGYERLLDRKEQELSEILLKMEVLGNSLEETEAKLNEVLKVCNCSSSQQKVESSQPPPVNGSRPTESEQFSSTAVDVQINGNHSHARTRSLSVGPSYEYVASTKDDPERFMSVIQVLETKLFVTEEKLRDITQRLEDHQGHLSCQDPQLCSQLTQSRAMAQHLSLLLHSKAKQSQRFAQETENCCRMLVGRFQVALNIIQTCREKLQTRQSSAATDATDFEKQLATVAACLKQGQRDAEKQLCESHNASKNEDKILNDKSTAGADSNIRKRELTDIASPEDDEASVGKCLMREMVVVEKMLTVLQSQNVMNQQLFVPLGGGDLVHRYKLTISQIINNKKSRGAECDSSDILESAIARVCAEAELVYAAFRLQQQYETQGKPQVKNEEHQRKDLEDISPPELAPYDEQDGREGAAKALDKDEKVEAEKKPCWLENLVARLQRRIHFLCQLCQEISGDSRLLCDTDHKRQKDAAEDVNLMLEQVKVIYLLERLYFDVEQELHQREALQDKLQSLSKQQDVSQVDEQEDLRLTLCELQEDNSVLREELERAEQKVISVEHGNKRLLEDIQKIEEYHEERMQKLETGFQKKIKELQQIHEEEMKQLHEHHTKHSVSKERHNQHCKETHGPSSPPGQGDTCQKEPGNVEACCDQSLTAMEQLHRKLIEDLQHQHQKQLEEVLKEKDQLLKEETAATMTAIVAMRRAHKEELERSRQSQHIMESADITQLRAEYRNGIQRLQKELEVLSLQHTQKCLENSQLRQELQDDREIFMQYPKENQRYIEEKSHLHFSVNGNQSHAASQANDSCEMDVLLRAREAEMEFLRQEARSLREELQIARMDTVCAQNKLKALCTSRHQDLRCSTWSPGRDAPELSPEFERGPFSSRTDEVI